LQGSLPMFFEMSTSHPGTHLPGKRPVVLSRLWLVREKFNPPLANGVIVGGSRRKSILFCLLFLFSLFLFCFLFYFLFLFSGWY